MRSTSPEPLPFLRSYPYEDSRQQSTWFLRATAISASWLALAGYTLFSLLVSPSDQLRWSTDVLASLGGIALTSGYVGGLIAFYFARTLAFRLDSVVLPLLLSSVGGLFAIVLNWALHQEVQTGKAYVYAPLGIACVTTVTCAATALYLNTQRKIRAAVEESSRRHLELTGNTNTAWSTAGADTRAITAGTPFLDHNTPHLYQRPSYHRSSNSLDSRFYHQQQHTPQYPNGNSLIINTSHALPRPYNLQTMPMPPPLRHMSSTELRPIEMNIPEDEAQRRQLLRLLIAKEQSSSNLGPENTSDVDAKEGASGGIGTYRIDWPGSALLDEQRGPLSPPLVRPTGKAVESVGMTTAFPPPPRSPKSQARLDKEERRRSAASGRSGGADDDGEISNRWSIGNLLGRRKIHGVGPGAERDEEATETEEERQARDRDREAMLQQQLKEERERRRREIERSSIGGA
jgi:hypothetical protein